MSMHFIMAFYYQILLYIFGIATTFDLKYNNYIIEKGYLKQL